MLSNLADSTAGSRDRRRLFGNRIIAPFVAKLVANPNEAALHLEDRHPLCWSTATARSQFAEYRETARLDPLNEGCRYELGIVLRRSGDIKGAIEAYRAAIKLAPTNPSYHEDLADLLRRSGDPNGRNH